MEQRRAKRLPAKLNLEVSSLFKQDHVKVEHINAPIEVFDISKGGIGFITNSVLPIGYYFNARLEVGTHGGILYCVVRILRSKENGDDGFIYGCEIVGPASIMDYVFEDYEESLEA